MFSARVVRDPVEHDPEVSAVCLHYEVMQRGDVTEDGVDIAVVADVVPTVGHR